MSPSIDRIMDHPVFEELINETASRTTGHGCPLRFGFWSIVVARFRMRSACVVLRPAIKRAAYTISILRYQSARLPDYGNSGEITKWKERRSSQIFWYVTRTKRGDSNERSSMRMISSLRSNKFCVYFAKKYLPLSLSLSLSLSFFCCSCVFAFLKTGVQLSSLSRTIIVACIFITSMIAKLWGFLSSVWIFFCLPC